VTTTRRTLLKVAATAPALAFPVRAFGQPEYPSRSITSIAMFAPGTGADIVVRYYSSKLQELIGRPVVVENKVGAAGNIATEFVAKSRPDGHTIYICPASSVFSAASAVFKKLNYDPINDFEPVTTLAKHAFVMTVAPDRPYRTLPEFTEYLRRKSGKAGYGSSTFTGLVASELYKSQMGLEAVEVKYRDAFTAINDMLAGHIDFFYTDPGTVKEMLATGKIRALVAASAERLAALPDVPGAREFRLNMDLAAYWTVHVPAKTPKPIIDRLANWFNQIAASPDVKAWLYNLGYDPWLGDAALAREMVVREAKAWARYVEIARIERQ
jgi:tripartite-type tricarboxylate transporter receptor subunit TctC